MSFLAAQAKAIAVGFVVLVVWAAMDWLSAKHGLPFGRDRNYFDTFFGAAAGASIVFMAQSPADRNTKEA